MRVGLRLEAADDAEPAAGMFTRPHHDGPGRYLAYVSVVLLVGSLVGLGAAVMMRHSDATPAPTSIPTPTVTTSSTLPGPIPVRHVTLTAPEGGAFTYTYSGDTVTASAPSPIGDTNVREVFWRQNTEASVNNYQCMTWFNTADDAREIFTQSGLAVRIAPTPDRKGWRAVTVTQNIWGGSTWKLNVHVWDTREPDKMTSVAVLNAYEALTTTWRENGQTESQIASAPFHVCAKLSGPKLAVKLWLGSDPEPSWSDATHVFHATLPDGWTYKGVSGGYVGHLHAGMSATFADDRRA